MKAVWIAAITLITLGVGYLVCPTTAGLHAPDASVVLHKAIEAQITVAFHGRQRYDDVCSGRRYSEVHDLCFNGSPYLVPRYAHRDRALRTALIEKNYTPLIEGEDTIAGRETWVLRMKPKVKNRPWKQIWVDKKTYATLASRDWTGRNAIKASLKTLDVTYDRRREYPSILVPGGVPLHKNRPLSIPRDFPRPAHIPRGFELWTVEVDKQQPGTQLVYTDGLYNISVFYGARADAARRLLKPGTVYDADQALVCVVSRSGRNALVVGDLPVEDIQEIAGSIR